MKNFVNLPKIISLIFLLINIIVTLNLFPTSAGALDPISSKLGADASLEFDILIFIALLNVLLFCFLPYKIETYLKKTFILCINASIWASNILLLVLSIDALVITGTDHLSNKIFRQSTKAIEMEATLLFWLLIFYNFFSTIAILFDIMILFDFIEDNPYKKIIN